MRELMNNRAYEKAKRFYLNACDLKDRTLDKLLGTDAPEHTWLEETSSLINALFFMANGKTRIWVGGHSLTSDGIIRTRYVNYTMYNIVEWVDWRECMADLHRLVEDLTMAVYRASGGDEYTYTPRLAEIIQHETEEWKVLIYSYGDAEFGYDVGELVYMDKLDMPTAKAVAKHKNKLERKNYKEDPNYPGCSFRAISAYDWETYR